MNHEKTGQETCKGESFSSIKASVGEGIGISLSNKGGQNLLL